MLPAQVETEQATCGRMCGMRSAGGSARDPEASAYVPTEMDA